MLRYIDSIDSHVQHIQACSIFHKVLQYLWECPTATSSAVRYARYIENVELYFSTSSILHPIQYGVTRIKFHIVETIKDSPRLQVQSTSSMRFDKHM